MSHRLLGIDLGAHSVKVAELDIGFRTTRLAELHSFAVPEITGPSLKRSLAALQSLGRVGRDDIVCVSIPGDRVLLRKLDVPFVDAKKLRAIVANELDDELPWEIDDVVFDFVAHKEHETVLAAAAKRDEIREVINTLAEFGLEPRQVCIAPFSYGGLLRRTYPDQTVLLIDLGHERTNLSLVADGHCLFARTISRGGRQITDELSRRFNLTPFDADRLKCSRAVVSAALDRLSANQRQIAEATTAAITPLVSEIKRTWAVASSHASDSIDRIVLCGGTSNLVGLDSYLQEELDTPVQLLDMKSDPELDMHSMAGESDRNGTLALATALEHGRRQTLDFRQDELSFRADHSFLRDKASALAIAFAAVLVCALFSAWASISSLSAEEKFLNKRLEQTTKRLFGNAASDPKIVSRKIKSAIKLNKGGDIPEQTAADVLAMLSSGMPPKDKVKVDVSRLDIRTGKTSIEGTAGSGNEVAEVVKALKSVTCFAEASAGRISEVADGKKKFSITIPTDCY